MKKLCIPLSVLLSFTVLLSACGRKTAENPSVTSVYDDAANVALSGSAETTGQASAFSETATNTSASRPETTTQPQTSAIPETAVTEASTSSKASEPTSSAPTGQFEVRQLNAERDGLSIYGNLYRPTEPGKNLPAVILSHSANMTSYSMKSYCERIAKMGFVAYSFDFCGGSTESRSSGKPNDMTVFTEVEDLKAVLQMIKGLDFVDKQNIFLFGTSQGGLVSALTAADDPDGIKGLLLFYPAFNIPDAVQKYAKVMPRGSLSPYITTLLDYDVYEHIKPYKGDVLIVHGTTDFVVPYTYSKKAAEVYENCEIHLITGGTHGFNADNYVSFGDFDRKTWVFAERFLKEHCK